MLSVSLCYAASCCTVDSMATWCAVGLIQPLLSRDPKIRPRVGITTSYILLLYMLMHAYAYSSVEYIG